MRYKVVQLGLVIESSIESLMKTRILRILAGTIKRVMRLKKSATLNRNQESVKIE